MLQKQLDVQGGDLVQVLQCQRDGGLTLKGIHLFRAELKKVSQIYGVSVSRQDAGLQFHGAKIQTGEFWKLQKDGPKLLRVIFFALEGVVAHSFILKQLFVKDKFNE